MSSRWKRLWALAAPWMCVLAMAVASDPARAAGYWELDTGNPVNCQGAILKAATPEGVMRAWIAWADGCPHDAIEHYEYLSCSYSTSNVSWAGSAGCWERTYAWWGALDHPHSITKYCLSGTIYSNDAHDCVCPPGQVWDEATQACAVELEEISVPYASDPPPPECEVCKGNPIYPLRGVKREVVDTGLAIGRTTLQFTYDNASRIPTASGALTDIGAVENRAGVMGSLQWVSNLHRQVNLFTVGSGSAPGLPVPTVFPRGNGVTKTMTSTDGGPRVGQADNADRFVQLPNGDASYTDSAANLQETYTGVGILTAMTWADGTRIVFTYDTTSGVRRLAQVSDNLGRSLSFGYTLSTSGVPRVSSITDATGGITTLSHDSRNNLVGITWADGRTRSFLYENADLPWALTGVSDERGLRYASFGYDAQGRAISTEHAGGTQKYTVSYTTPPSIQVTKQNFGSAVARFHTWNLPQGTVMTEPSGQVTSWSALSLNGKNYFSSQTQPAGAGSLQSSRSQAYDANGNIASRDDFNGKRSCYLNDLPRNLKIAQVTGLNQGQDCTAVTTTNATLPAGALKTSTQWHPDWSLPIKVAEPSQITINVYNGQPDPLNGNAVASCAPTAATLPDGKPIAALCKQVTRATTDADGHLGFGAALQAGTIDTVRTWTYDADGRMLTATDPDTDTTTFGYHTEANADHQRSDLKSITTSLGKVTTFDRYNRYGQVLQSTDPRGIVTVNTYDLRQRLLTNTVGGETTTYAYDEAGQLKKVSFDNGTWVGFDYDDAHRQVAAYDNKANRIDYVLDNAGNQTDQRVKDPVGALKRGLARAMDALGRAQQSTGKE
ncbi:RHS repeat protein [Rhizobacter sp. OV335]|uniref:RHS repeat protein n=1 Tax=Rhizobacter sp. OV335 TaxID=1500264 RepID=UPI000922BE0F|nr:RHS repeat protein [Rhizobacter sp. OV335]SHM29350.1 YD repeat-containing protein [Rhizobacter sp. OV335]